MGLDLWFREDIARILAGLARQAARRNDGDYQAGYLDALADVALSFGVVNRRAQRQEPMHRDWPNWYEQAARRVEQEHRGEWWAPIIIEPPERQSASAELRGMLSILASPPTLQNDAENAQVGDGLR